MLPERRALIERLAAELIEALGGSAEGACDLCARSHPRRNGSKTHTHRRFYEGRSFTTCTYCDKVLRRRVETFFGESSLDAWHRMMTIDRNNGSLDSLPSIVIAEWLAARMLVRGKKGALV